MDFFRYSDEEIYSIAKPILDSMRDGTNRNDYNLFSSYFSAKMFELVGEKKFTDQTTKHVPEFGELGHQQILGYIRRESGVTVVYKQNTTKRKGELLGQLLLDDENGKVKVVSASIY